VGRVPFSSMLLQRGRIAGARGYDFFLICTSFPTGNRSAFRAMKVEMVEFVAVVAVAYVAYFWSFRTFL